MDGHTFSTSRFTLKALCTIFVPTQTHHTTALLAAFRRLMLHLDKGVLVERIWKGWFPAFFDAVNPSKLPFTNEFESLHTQLVEVLNDRLQNIWDCKDDIHCRRSREDITEIYRSFHKQTRDYIIHLSPHPFVLFDRIKSIIVIDFLIRLFQNSRDYPAAKSFRDELRQQMDEVARSSSSPPFILTSELVCRLTNEEILNVIDRIVGLLASDSCLDDDTILRICTFHENQLKSVYLPELFRKAGRTSEQYFHVLQSLLSLNFDYFYLHPINYLLHNKPIDLQPTFDEWDDVDLETVGVVMGAIRENRLSFKHAWPRVTQQLLARVEQALLQVHHSASRLCQSQLERLLSPSIDILTRHCLLRSNSSDEKRNDRERVFIEICRLCEQRTIVRCLSSVGFFSGLVSGMLNDSTCIECICILNVFVPKTSDSCKRRAEKTKIRRAIPLFLEEGWQDAVEFIFVRKKVDDYRNLLIAVIQGMMQFHGANLGDLIDWYDTD
ncbi:hypothetical protein BLNAU_10405 [Blattamonas nauphoetae]|uniref:Uncharacterized protein n=1 Tax=Blattamonas nauphoetae TaxID=2049346 RepID=A0ABQ9XRY8_9EUKA|nr:hypothetical protein BLNAU_10405 [Blattamonas nauphoetae]